MSQHKHSPIPWTLTELPPDNDGETEPIYRLEADRTLFLTIAPCSDGYAPGENAANAHLLWAAPDLLEACEEVIRMLGRKDAHLYRAGELALKAIAKAKGESSS